MKTETTMSFLGDGHEVTIEARPFEYGTGYGGKRMETFYKVVCSCGEHESLEKPWRDPDFMFTLDHATPQRFVARHRRIVNGEKGIYACGCTVEEQGGKRGTYCRDHMHRKYIPLKPSTYKPSPISSTDIVKALADKYGDRGRSNEWAFFAELRVGTGYRRRGVNPEQRLDAFVINLWPSKSFHRIAFEVKVSRGDFLNEIKRPEKRASALQLSNEFYFAVPKGLVKKEEIPEDCGLMEVDVDGKVRTIIKAPYHEGREEAPWTFLASIARRVQDR